MTCPLKSRNRKRISLASRLRDLRGGQMRLRVERSFLSCFDLFHDKTCNRRSGGERFNMSALSTSANRPVGIDGHMTQFRPHPAKTLKQTAARDYPSTDASADGKVDHILMSLACTELPLGEAR